MTTNERTSRGSCLKALNAEVRRLRRTLPEQIADTIIEATETLGGPSTVLQLWGFEDWPDVHRCARLPERHGLAIEMLIARPEIDAMAKGSS